MVTLSMPSRLRSATVIPEMRLSQGPPDDGVQTPRCFSRIPPLRQAINAARLAGVNMEIGALGSLGASDDAAGEIDSP
jgi:hypothetical protein